jgi:hypothetical protein
MLSVDFNKLPNFFIIGAAKSGTTSLFDIISQHPDIYTCQIKETHFFSNDDRFKRGVDWYQETHFSGAGGFAVRSEATPAYLGWSHKVAPRIKDLYQDRPLKFAAIFRDPVKRAYSHYWDEVRQGDEDPNRLSFAKAIHTEEKRLQQDWSRLEYTGKWLHGYYRAGCYATRLKPFFELYPRENFFFMLQEDLYNDFDASMSRLLRFLEVDDQVTLTPVVSNESAMPRDRNIYNLFKKLKDTKIKDFMKLFIPASARKWLRNDAILKPFSYQPMDDDIKRELYDRFADEIKQLEIITGRNLSHWKYQ